MIADIIRKVGAALVDRAELVVVAVLTRVRDRADAAIRSVGRRRLLSGRDDPPRTPPVRPAPGRRWLDPPERERF
jgi:hypothetical protein